MSNETKKSFIDFVKKHELERTDPLIHGVVIDGRKFIYQIPNEGKIGCRQFYEDYDGIIYPTLDSYSFIEKSKLTLSERPTRIRPNGIKAYNASYSLSQ